MSVPVLVTADWQLADNPRDRYRFDFLERVLPEIILRKKIKVVLILGDLTEEKDRHPATLVNRIVDGLCKLDCAVVILRGNHDYDVDSDHPFFGFVRRITKLHWVQNIAEDGGDLDKAIGKCIFLPYTKDHEHDWANIDFSKFDWVFAHNTFDGADAGHGYSMRGIPTKIFHKRNLVLAGDVHTPQDVGPVTYVGAPYLCDFGDDYQPRVLVIDGPDLISVKVHGPNKRLLDIDANFKTAKPVELNPGDIVKVRVTLTQGEYEDWQKIRDKVHRWGEKGQFIIDQVTPVVDRPTLPKGKPMVLSRKVNDEELVRRYAKQQSMSKQALVAGLKYLEE